MTNTTDDFRMGERETLDGPAGPVTIQVCEELDAESGRWEPFVTVLKGKIR